MKTETRTLLGAAILLLLMLLDSNGVIKVSTEAITLIGSVFIGGQFILGSAKVSALGNVGSEIVASETEQLLAPQPADVLTSSKERDHTMRGQARIDVVDTIRNI
jgi:predicted phage tail protein